MSYPKVMTYRLAISATRCASSLITSLDKSPLYKNTGSPSSTSELNRTGFVGESIF